MFRKTFHSVGSFLDTDGICSRCVCKCVSLPVYIIVIVSSTPILVQRNVCVTGQWSVVSHESTTMMTGRQAGNSSAHNNYLQVSISRYKQEITQLSILVWKFSLVLVENLLLVH